MNCSEKFRRLMKEAGGATKVEPEEVDGRAVCNHPGCGKRLLGDGHCVDGHAQGTEQTAAYPEALDGLLCLSEQLEAQGQLYSDVPWLRQEQESLWQEARSYREQASQAAPSTAQYGEGRRLVARLRHELLGEPQLADDPRMQMAGASISEEDLIAVATEEMRARIDDGRITTARDADQAAADVAAEFVGNSDSDDYIAVCAALCDIAGQEFPGEWDEEVGEGSAGENEAEARWQRSCSYCGRDKDGGTCIICGNFVCDQCQSSTDDGPVCPNCVDAARKQGYVIDGEEEWSEDSWSDMETTVHAVGSMAREWGTELSWSTTRLNQTEGETLKQFRTALAKLPLLEASAALLQVAEAYAEDAEPMPTRDSLFLLTLSTTVAHAHAHGVAPDFPPLVAAEALLEQAGQVPELAASGEHDVFSALRTAVRAAEPSVREEVGRTGRLLRAYLGGAALTPDEKAWAAAVAWDESPVDIRYPLVRAIGRYRRMEQAGDAAAAWEWYWLSPERKKAVLQWLTRTGHPLGKFPPLGDPDEWPQLPREPGGARAQAVFQRVIRALAVSESVSPDRLDTLRRDPPPGEVPLIDLPDNVIEVDTRHGLVTEGILKDVSLQAQNEWGYKWPVAVTRGVQAALEDIAPPFRGFQTPEARLNDVLMMARSAARRLGSVPLADEVKARFRLILPTSESTDWSTWEEGADEEVGLTTLVIERNFASADDPRPCFTISLVDDY